MDKASIVEEALRLGVEERAQIADTLLASLDTEAKRQIEKAWTDEAEARLEAYRNGEVEALNGTDALRELYRGLPEPE